MTLPVSTEKALEGASYLAGTILTLTGFTLEEWFGLIGVLTVVATFLVTWYYKDRADRRAQKADERAERELKLREFHARHGAGATAVDES